MENALPGVRPGIQGQAITAFRKPRLGGDFGRSQHHVAEQRLIFRGSLVHVADMLAGDDQDMGRRLGTDVVKGDYEIVDVDLIARNFAGHDLAENAIFDHAPEPWREMARRLTNPPGLG